MENFNELDAIFYEIVTIKVAPKNSRVKIAKDTYKTVVYLSVATDQRDLYEISNIRDKDKRSCIVVQGLSEALEIGSWIKKSELSDLIRQNKDIRFIVGMRVHGE